MRKILFAFFILLLTTTCVSALEVNITSLPDEIHGGDSYDLYLNFTSSKETTVSIGTPDILPDTIGVNIIYSETDFVFTGEKSIVVYVSFSPYLSPEHNIDIITNYDYTEKGVTPSKKKTTTTWSGTWNPIPEEDGEPWYHPTPLEPVPRVNVQDPITITIYREFNYTPYILVGIGILILGSIFIIIWKKKKSKEVKKHDKK